MTLGLGAGAQEATPRGAPSPAPAGKATTPKAPLASPDDPAQRYSRYERETIDRALALEPGAVIDEAPVGKLIEAVEIVPLDVLEDRDPPGRVWKPLTGFLNWFHSTSRPAVIDREILLHEGDRYDHALVDETAKNLRALRQISLVLCVPLRGSRPDRVRLLVITKDVWSLRLNSNFRFAGGRLQYLLLQPSEENLVGTHQSLSGQFLLDGETYSLGGTYSTPRIQDSRRALLVSANVIVNRYSGDSEGSFGSLSYGQPLYSTLAEWSWVGTLGWRREITRRYVDGQQAFFVADSAPDVDPLPPAFAIPYRWNSDLFAATWGVVRSFGRKTKHDLEGGFEVSRRVFTTDDLSAYDPASARSFVDRVVPVSDDRAYPYIAYSSYSTELRQTRDLATLGLQEDLPVGHNLFVKVYPVVRALGSSRDFVGLAAGGQYTLPWRDGFVTGYVQSVTEAEVDRLADASIEGGLEVATPGLRVGRFVADGRVVDRYRNYLKRTTTLGGDRRLRGYPTGQFFGADVLVGNVEFRTRPIEAWTVQIGAAAFYDVGDAFDQWSELRAKHAVGGGLRVVFPQLDRAVLRADWGFPLTKPTADDSWTEDGFPGDILLTFRQAFGAPSVPSRFSE